MTNYLMLSLCVLGMSIGQIIYKEISLEFSLNGIGYKSIILFSVSILIYFSMSILWIYLIKDIPISRAYSFTALAYVFVPIIAYFTYNENISIPTILGMILIIIGVSITASN